VVLLRGNVLVENTGCSQSPGPAVHQRAKFGEELRPPRWPLCA